MKFMKTKFAAMGLALATSLSIANVTENKVSIKLTDTTPIDNAQDVVNYLSSNKDELASYLPDGHSISINVINIVVPHTLASEPKHKKKIRLSTNDGIQAYGERSATLDIPGGHLSRPYRLQLEYSIVDDAGSIVTQGKKSLRLDSSISVDRAEEPYIEQRYMLNNWMKKTFSEKS